MKTKLSLITIAITLVMCSTSAYLMAQESAKVPKIERKEIAAQKAVSIRVAIPSSAIKQKMSEMYGKLYSYLGANNIQPTGVPFAVYYAFDPNGNTDFEVGIPVGTTVKSSGDIKFKEYPAMKVLAALYVGPYENSGPVYEALMKYAKDNKLETLAPMWEIYLTDPSKETDPAKYQTLIYHVLK